LGSWDERPRVRIAQKFKRSYGDHTPGGIGPPPARERQKARTLQREYGLGVRASGLVGGDYQERVSFVGIVAGGTVYLERPHAGEVRFEGVTHSDMSLGFGQVRGQ
jgi:hypothetical protein